MCPTRYRLLVVISFFCTAIDVWAQDLRPTPDPRFRYGTINKQRRWAILIGVSEYSNEPAIPYAENDARLIHETLCSGGDFDPNRVLVISDNQKIGFRPTLKAMTEEIPRFLENVKSDGVLFVYFSGHGAIGSDGKAYLCPSGFDRNSPSTTGLLMADLRKMLLACNAKERLLVLDCCHAGAEKGVEIPSSVNSNNFVRSLQNTKGLVTLASCRSDQFSYEDDNKRLGIFSMNVAEALRGRCDLNRDGVVDSNEIFDWCSERVPAMARMKHGKNQTPVLIGGDDQVIRVMDTQYSPDVDHLVNKRQTGIFAIECPNDRRGAVRASSFAIRFDGNMLYLVTTANAVEDEEGILRSPKSFRLQSNLLTLEAKPTRIFVHPKRRARHGPDVAIIEVPFITNEDRQIPSLFSLMTPNELSNLKPQECAFLSYPNRQTLVSLSTPQYVRGTVEERVTSGTQNVVVRSEYPNESDGAPIFIVRDVSERTGQRQEFVFGITANNRIGDRFLAESVRGIWEIVESVAMNNGIAILPPIQRPRDGMIETKVSVAWQEKTDRAVKLAVQAGRQKNWETGLQNLSDLERELSQEGVSSMLNWEFYSLRGVLLAHRGFQQNDKNDRQGALASFDEARSDCERAFEMAPNELYPTLMLARLYNNLGTANNGFSANQKQVEFLKWTHDKIDSVLKAHEKHEATLSPQQLAQCHYLLGYAHEKAGMQICKTANGRQDFQKSWALFHSNQVSTMLKTQANDTVDIWNEFDQLLHVWQSRNSTECKSCQAAKKCETCN